MADGRDVKALLLAQAATVRARPKRPALVVTQGSGE
jgi:hypothetical protein